MTRHRILLLLAAVVGSLVVLGGVLWFSGFGILNSVARKTYLAQPVNENLRRHLELVRADRAELAKYDLFGPSAGHVDAAPFLNPKLHWFGKVAPEWTKPQALDLPPELSAAISLPNHWQSQKIDWARWKLDFGWLAQLSKFDVWTTDSQSPAVDDQKDYRATDQPMPAMVDLLHWSKLRLLKAKEDGDVGLALAQVQHLARLLWTTDYLVGAMVSIAVLQDAADFAAAQTPPVILPGLPSVATVHHARRYVWLVGLGLDPRLDDAGWAELAREPGLCIAVNERIPEYAGIIRPLLSDDFAAPLARFDALVRQTTPGCRPSWRRKLWQNPSLPVLFADDDDMFGEAARLGKPADTSPSIVRWSQVKNDPKLAKAVGYPLIGIGEPDPLRRYEETPDAGASSGSE